MLYEHLPFNFMSDIAPIASINLLPQVMVVNPTFPAKTVPEFIAYAKANPGKINLASTGSGNLSHLSIELFKMMAGVDIVHVPYRGAGPAQTDLLGGRVDGMFDTIPALIDPVRAGRLRGLAVTTAKRLRRFARPADGRRFRAGLRGQRPDRYRRAKRHAAGDRRAA